MAKIKDNVRHIVGINGENNTKRNRKDLLFVSNELSCIILKIEKGFQ